MQFGKPISNGKSYRGFGITVSLTVFLWFRMDLCASAKLKCAAALDEN